MKEKLRRANRFLLIIFPLVFVVSLDQASKFLASKYLTIYCNEGGVFGFFASAKESNQFFSLLSLGILIYLIYLASKEKNLSGSIPVLMIAGGGFSNLWDRISLGCVRDFIVIFNWFPRFNLADSLICLGVFIFMVSLLKNFRKV